MEVQNSINRHINQIESAIASQATSSIVASWRRSLTAHKLDPGEFRPPRRVAETILKETQQSLEPLMRVAVPVLDRLFQGVANALSCVVLADCNGVVLTRRGGVDDRAFESFGLWPGEVWSEDSEGTNGIGTCLVEQRPLTIQRAQHFLVRNTQMSCAAAPVFDQHGKLAAALAVCSCRAEVENFIPLILIAVSDGARRIETENFRTSFPRSRISIVPVVDHHTAAALIATDMDDIVIGANRSARLQLGITQATIDKGLPAGALIKGLTHAVDAFAEAERGVLYRALAETDGNVTAAARTLGISRATLHRKMKKIGFDRR
jgi:transcriptional regulator of acetoin/glycerol metabolism